MPQEMPKASGLSREQRIGVVLLSVFAFFALGLGVLQIRNSMYAPFSLNEEVPVAVDDKIDMVSALHYRDTDMDGLNDFDELYVYGTSPYLADTDSDGIKDKEEVDSGKNPNCAEGKPCEGAGEEAPLITATLENGLENEAQTLDILNNLQNPTQIKEMLKNYGMDEETLNSIPDEELLILVNDLLASSTAPLAPVE